MARQVVVVCVLVLFVGNAQAMADEPAAVQANAAPPSDTEIAEAPAGACDFEGFMRAAAEVQSRRRQRLVSAAEFANMAADPKTLVLDARSPEAFAALRVKGSVNLPYTDFSAASLRKLIPDEQTRILIYCRNNIASMGEGPAVTVGLDSDTGLPTPSGKISFRKAPSAGLNIPTVITLYAYGYRNVYELDPVVDPHDSVLEFVGTSRPTPRETKTAAAP